MKVNCAALNESLLESELFGHVRGAFHRCPQRGVRGASRRPMAGISFWMKSVTCPWPPRSNCSGCWRKRWWNGWATTSPIQVDVRIVSATNRDLKQLIDQGAFREDFYYRINVIPIHIPSLAGAARGHPPAGPKLSQPDFAQKREKDRRDFQGGPGPAGFPSLAGKRQGAEKRLRVRRGFLSGGMIDIQHLPPPHRHGTAPRVPARFSVARPEP